MTQPYMSPLERRDVVPPSGSRERPLREIVGELWENTEKLVRQELELAMAELDEKVTRLKTDVVAATLGGAVIYAGVLSIVAAVIMLLSKAIDPWLAALIVGIVVSGAGFAMIQKGRKDLESGNLAPKQTERSIQRTAHTFKEAVK